MPEQDVMVALAEFRAEVRGQLEQLSDRLGFESEDGKGGTGLTGRVVRTEDHIESMIGLRNKATGLIMGLTLVFVLVVGGVKSAVGSALAHLMAMFT